MILDDNDKPKVSIVIPIYNAEKNLSKCLESVLAQDYENYEIILVDDGSTDTSAEICLQYANGNPNRILYFEQNNSGPASARNMGISRCSGKYIMFVDSDDTIVSDMIGKMVDVAERNMSPMVVCAYYKAKNDNVKTVTYKYPDGNFCDEKALSVARCLIDETSEKDIPPYSWVRLTLRSVFTDSGIRFQDGLKRSEDYHFWVKIHFFINQVYLMSTTPLYVYNDNVSSVTHNYVNHYWDDVLFIYNDLLASLPVDREISNRLDNMLVTRSLIALNNATKQNGVMKVYREVVKIANTPALRNAVENLTKDQKKKRGAYPLLIKYNCKAIIFFRYLWKYISK